MEMYRLVNKIHTVCPLCDKEHNIEERKRTTSTMIKGEVVEYEEHYYFCAYSREDENEYTPAKMESDNLLNARNAYRKKNNLLTSYEIVELRERYGLSQIDLAKLLGWGEATISRYESKAIQDEAYDMMLRIIRDNPYKAYELLQKRANEFSETKYNDIRRKIEICLYAYGCEYLKRQALESEYVKYREPSLLNGFQVLNVQKVESIISYLASHIDNLHKVKLMKILWYTDALCYKQNGKAMTGLVYCHEAMGALPVGHYKLVDLEIVNMKEEEDGEYIKYSFLPNRNIDFSCLSEEEKNILDMVISKFKDFSTSEIVSYMHEEKAYLETKDKEVISFEVAKEIREF